jgi:plastocyanin
MSRIAALLLAAAPFAVMAAGEPELTITIENHRFSPEKLEVPAGKKVKLTVDNRDATPEEFESSQLKVEKVIPGKSKGIVFLGPLKPGEYPFVGEYHEQTAKGVVVAK